MNEEYINIDNNYIIKDSNNNHRLIKNVNNIDELLIQENIVELISTKLNNLENKNNMLSKSIKEDKKWFKIYMFITITIFFITFILSGSLVNNFINSKIICNIINLVLSYTISLLPFSIGIQSFNSYKKYAKEKNGISSEVSYLEKKLKVEKKKLEELNKENRMTKSINSTKVDNTKVNEINKECLLYYDCGVNKDKYSKYLDMNILDKKLRKKYNEEELEKVKEYTINLKLVKRK